METWFVIVVTLCITALIRSILSSIRTVKKQPPGPSFLYSTFLLLTNSILDFEPVLIKLKATYGPLISLSIGYRRTFFVGSHSLAHEILIQKDTTTNALQWIMANILKHPHIQSKLYNEIISVVGRPPNIPKKGVELEAVINQEDLQKMPYLKAVVLEGLRRHPPGHFVLPHKVTKDVEIKGYVIPQGATVNFMVAEMGMDPKVWDDPMEFKPERFMSNDGSNSVFDISGSKGIKMMPFGAGRRICPGSDLALLHLEYFVANLIWYFDWSVPDGYCVDLSEKIEFTVVMMNPLQAQISLRAEIQLLCSFNVQHRISMFRAAKDMIRNLEFIEGHVADKQMNKIGHLYSSYRDDSWHGYMNVRRLMLSFSHKAEKVSENEDQVTRVIRAIRGFFMVTTNSAFSERST
nr:cytochrome P450 89A2-like [Tanacetum cinerariifolium]